MKIKSFFVTLFSIIGSLIGGNNQNLGFESISTDDFEKAITDDHVIILDVRSAEEFANGHIAHAINIDLTDDAFEQKALDRLDKSKTIAIYCKTGIRSKKAARILVDNGYTVIEMKKGFDSWLAAEKDFVLN